MTADLRALRMSAADQKRLASASRALLSPGAEPSLEDWGLRVGGLVRDLLGADQFVVRLPLLSRAVLCSDAVDTAAIQAYPASCHGIAVRTGMWERGVRLRAYTREQLWHGHMDEYFRSAYYHEYLVPHRGFHATGMSASVEPRHSEETVAQLLVHTHSEAARGFGPRELALLHLLHPSYEAGVYAAARLLHERESLARMIDALSDGIAVFDRSAVLIHRNRALQRLLALDGADATLARAIHTLARDVAPLLGSVRRTDSSPVPSARLVRQASVGTTHLTLRATLLAPDAFGAGSAVMVMAEKVGLDLPGDAVLRERHGLTRREAETARLVAQGHTNEQLAERLGVSVPTARHHVEAVLLKLGLHSRGEVANSIVRRAR